VPHTYETLAPPRLFEFGAVGRTRPGLPKPKIPFGVLFPRAQVRKTSLFRAKPTPTRIIEPSARAAIEANPTQNPSQRR